MDRIFDYEWSTNQLLGKGSYSNVYKGIYKGYDNKIIKKNSIIAIKVICIKNLNKKGLEVVNDEIKIMKMIKKDPHPNIVGCYDVFQDSDYTYIILEYCDSGNLRNILKKPLKEKYAQYYFSQITKGLQYLDKRHILHRDMKPKNILLANNRRTIKIADFGFAKSTSSISLHETMCGSPLYMAPEIFDKDAYNNQTDLWSIGMILFEMIYGYHPLNNCNSLSDIKDTLNNSTIMIPPENNTNKDVTIECLTFMKSLLQKDAKNRMTWNDFFDHSWNNPNKNDNGISLTSSFHPTLTSTTASGDSDEGLNNAYHSKLINKNIEVVHDYVDSINEKRNFSDNLFQMEIDVADEY